VALAQAEAVPQRAGEGEALQPAAEQALELAAELVAGAGHAVE